MFVPHECSLLGEEEEEEEEGDRGGEDAFVSVVLHVFKLTYAPIIAGQDCSMLYCSGLYTHYNAMITYYAVL